MNESVDPNVDNISSLARAQQLARYEYALRYVRDGDRVVDAACGVGYGSRILAQKARKIFAIDRNREFVEYAQRKYDHPRIDHILTDLNYRLPILRNSVDVLVSLETVEHLNDPFRFLENGRRTLRDSGTLILSFPNPSNEKYNSNPHHNNNFDLPSITKWLLANYSSCEFKGQGIVLGSVLGRMYKNGFKPGVTENHPRIKGFTDRLPFFSYLGSRVTSCLTSTAQYMYVVARR